MNPLEEYLSAPKNPRKKPIEQPEKKDNKAEAQVETNEVQTKQEAPVQAQPRVVLDQHVEVDGQGQLAIKGTKVPEVKKERPAKQRITLHISTDLVDRIKNAVYWEPGLTVAGFAEEAFIDAINVLEKERGEPFPQRKYHRLRGGRPVS